MPVLERDLKGLAGASGEARVSSPRLLKDAAFIDLERMIVTGGLAPGAWVSESDLMTLTGHTRASVRHAIARLAEQALVDIYPRRGAQVCPIDYRRHFRLLETRRVVEPFIVRSAAARASEAQRAELLVIAESFERLAREPVQARMTELDLRHFALIVEAADNPYAAKAISAIKGLSRRFWVLHQAEFGSIPNMALGHAGVARAVSAGDEMRASAASDTLLDYVERFTLTVVGARLPAGEAAVDD